MEEFRIAHEQVVSGRRKFLIPVLLEDINKLNVPNDLRLYLDTYTYLEVQSSDSLARKKLRYAMPKTPLKDLKSLAPRREYKRIRSSTSQTKQALAAEWTEDSATDSDHDSCTEESDTLKPRVFPSSENVHSPEVTSCSPAALKCRA